MVPLATMTEDQKKDPIFGVVYQYVAKDIKSKPSAIAKIPSKSVRKYLLQCDWLNLKKDVLHHLYINNDVEYHQLVLPEVYGTAVLQTTHEDYGHQGLDWTLSLAHEKVNWSAMYQDVTDYVTNCPYCQIARGHYVGPNTQPGPWSHCV